MWTWALLLVGLIHCTTAVFAGAPLQAVGKSDLEFDSRLAPDRVAVDRAFAHDLAALSQKCRELKLDRQASITEHWQIPRRYRVQYCFLPDFYARDIREKRIPGPPDPKAPELEQFWFRRFSELRGEQAERLFGLAKKRLAEGRSQESFALLHEVLRENPDHAEARRILGYSGKPGKWLPIERQPKYSKTTSFETTFNWAPNRHGVVDSAHFRLRTNADAATAVEASIFLEECHDVWRIVFSGFWLPPEELEARFAAAAPVAPKKAFEKQEVILFASREEYVAQLEPFESKIATSRGYYAPGRKTSFFYVDPADTDVRSNWSHEISHQLFSAYSRNPPGLTRNANFWVIEGAAMYMESLRAREGYFTTGGFESERLQDARHRHRNLREHALLTDLLPLGQDAFQKDPRIRQFYTAGAGYTHFLLDGKSGKHRDAFLQFLRSLYDEQDEVGLLQKALDVPPGDLEVAYAEFLDVTDADLLTLQDASVKRLVLGRTSVTEKGLTALQPLKSLRKLDLTELKFIHDDSLPFLSPDCDLEELSLFGLPLSSECGMRLARMRSLKELDLSRTEIDDRAIASLADLPALRSLSLHETKLTDTCEPSLMKLKALRELNATGTHITPACIERLKKSNPELSITP